MSIGLLRTSSLKRTLWIHVKYTGTHTVEWRGLAPTGKKKTFTNVQIYHIVDVKIIERKSVSYILNVVKKLGVIKYTEKGKKFFLKIFPIFTLFM